MKHNGIYAMNTAGASANVRVRTRAPHIQPYYQNQPSPSTGPTKRRQSRQKRRTLQLVCVCFVAVVLFVLWHAGAALVHWVSGSSESKPFSVASILQQGAQGGMETQDVLNQLRALQGAYPTAALLLQNAEAYPQNLLELAVRNPETIAFVAGYLDGARPSPTVTQTELQAGVPLFLQWDARWGYETYGDQMMALSGCGPTCLAMAAAYLTGNTDVTPLSVAQYSEQAGYYISGTGTSWDLLGAGAQGLGLQSEQLPLDESAIYTALQAGRPVICSVGPGDFTTAGHFIVLTGIAEDGNLTLHDPNSPQRSSQTWSFNQLRTQIKNLWAYSLAG